MAANAFFTRSSVTPGLAVPADTDGDDSTAMSSSADLVLPEGSSIEAAYLFAEVDGSRNAEVSFDEVQFQVPGGEYQTLTAPEALAVREADGGGYGIARQLVFDVTDLMPDGGYVSTSEAGGTSSGEGRYTVAADQMGGVEGGPAAFGMGGWSIIVVYSNDDSPVRNVTVADDWQYFHGTSVDVTIPGVVVPSSGEVQATVGLTGTYGDPGFTDEIILGVVGADGQRLTSPNPTADREDRDALNASIAVASSNNVSADGGPAMEGTVVSRDPYQGFSGDWSGNDWLKQYPDSSSQYDASIFDAAGAIPPSSTPVDIQLTQRSTSDDALFSGAYFVSVDQTNDAPDNPPIFLGCTNLTTFDEDNAGWRAATTTNGTQLNWGPVAVGWEANAGNPGGAIIEDDLDGNWTELWTPELAANGYATDYSFAVGESFQFDYRNNTGISYDIYAGIVGANGSYYWYSFRDQIVDSTVWTRVMVPLEASQWHTGFNNNSGPTGPAPSAEDFEAALSDVDRFTFSIEGQWGDDRTAFDNFGQPCDDFGDAPESYGTTLVDHGPSHRVLGADTNPTTSPLMLGTSIDIEDEGQPGAAADGDDTTGIADEDGVATAIQITSGSPATLTVSATNDTGEPATLGGWIDLDGSGTFDAAELVATTVPASSGTADYELTFPAGTVTTDTYARFRIFPGELDPADVLPTGSAEAGEVEDYLVTVGERSLEITKSSDATAATQPGDTVTYTITATNTGTSEYTDQDPAVVLDDLSEVLDDASYNNDGAADQPGAVSYAAPLLSWTGGLAADESVVITYSTTLTANGDGIARNVAWQPVNPQDPQTPTCDPADEDGLDPDTGEPCAATEFQIPRLTIEKSADRTELPATGEVVEYTITVTNEGPGAYTQEAPATATDNLTDVLDAAEYNDDAEASTGSMTFEDGSLSWSGALVADESAVITYSVTYTGEGDQNLRNLACVPDSAALAGTPPCAFVQIPGAGLTQWKQVRSSDTPAVAGSVLTYTLFFHNDGEAAAIVDAVDDLTHVLDDADLTDGPGSEDGLNATFSGSQISITGDVPTGETYTVSYQTTVRADGERGDDIAANFLLDAGEQAPPEPECEPTSEQFPDCTATPIAAVEYTKSVASSTDPVETGTVLTYTVTVVNTGAVTAPVSRDDVLSDVLDDAQLTSQPESDTGSVTVSDVAGDRIAIRGEIAPETTATIIYQVTVNDEADRGNNTADNFLVPAGSTPPDACEEGSVECTSTGLPLIEADKSARPEPGTSVAAGQEVSYALFFTNSGEGTGVVDYTDDLSGVFDDATLTAGPVSDADALTASVGADDTIHVIGELDVDQRVMVTYTVTVNDDNQRGDNHLGNVLARSNVDDPQCGDAGVSCTDHPVVLLESWKSVEADETPVSAGTVLTYTLFFENSGNGTATVDAVDDLSHVTDDATVTTKPSSEDLDVVRDGDRITVSGSVPSGERYTVTYQVTVGADGERGDDIAANYLMRNDPDNPPAAPEDPVCQPDDAERPDCTATPIGMLLTSKSVAADTDPVDVGTVLTYTLTFDNQGAGPIDVDHTDVVTDVLDDAELTSNPVASDDVLEVSTIQEGAFTITGELASGQTVTVTYQVTVNPEGDRGDNSAANYLVPTGEQPPAECAQGDANCTVTPLPLVTVAKSADPGAGSGVQAGEEVSYSLTFTNTGEAAGSVDYSDDLSGVLDDAALTGAPQSSDPALAATDGADGVVRVTGALEPGQTVTVTYTVTVRPDGQHGDNQLENVVAKTGTEDPQCGSAAVACTTHPVGELEDWKSVDPAIGSTVRPAQELTYTLHFANIGTAEVAVNRDDVLTQLLDDADITAQPVASSGALAVTEITDGRFSVTGSLEPGQAETVSYQVRVKADGERGDDRLDNFLVPSGEEPPADMCTPADGETPDCTYNHVSNVSVVKSSDPESGTEVNPGDQVTYTVTFTNSSANADAAPVAVDYTDHMADVLDDATLTSGPVVSSGNLAAEVVGDTIQITGDVPTAEVYSVTYVVTVNAYDEQENHWLGNVVAITGEVPVCVEDSPLCTEHDIAQPNVPAPSEPLPDTGAAFSLTKIGVALLLLAGGGVLLVFVARRRSHAESGRYDLR